MKERLFSGIQPTGNLHIGNYLGAMRQWVSMQARYNSIFCIVDLHAITVPQSPAKLRAKTRETAALLIAAGIDPQTSVLFVQSRVSAHAELAWLLDCLIPVGWLERMTQFKEKTGKAREGASTGLFNYPALMAADILLYETDIVPVGEDQLQHLELTRDVAQRFNSIYGQTFKLPRAVVPEAGARIMGLDNPNEKMSKSESRPGHAIHLLDSAGDIRAKISRATTDSLKEIRFDEARPGIHNLLTIYQLLTGLKRAEIEERFAGKGYAQFKQELAEVVVESLRPLQTRYTELSDSPDFIDSIIIEGTNHVSPMALKTLSLVKAKMGLG